MPDARAPSALTEDELGSPAQRDRRTRMLDATLALASKGGFEAVQMRAVAERADVALGTLYRYFPSKIHLLVSAMIRELGGMLERLDRRAIPGDTPTERVLFVLTNVTLWLQRDPMLTEAMTRAFMVADTSAAAEVTEVVRLCERMITIPLGVTEPSEEDRALAGVIIDVWMAKLIAWITRRATTEDVTSRLELAVRLLLDPR